jgi:5-methylcytosine-specific restriction endonuclease McrA
VGIALLLSSFRFEDLAMRRTFCILLLFTGLFLPSGLARTWTHSTYPTRAEKSSRSAHVRSYTRRDGTYGSQHSRKTRGTSTARSRVPRSAGSPRTYTNSRSYSDSGRSASAITRDKHGRIKRSAAAKNAFKHQQPCPSTGRSSGACPGYVIDHLKPLECGGADSPSNMQWQTTADGKAKDKTERFCR